MVNRRAILLESKDGCLKHRFVCLLVALSLVALSPIPIPHPLSFISLLQKCQRTLDRYYVLKVQEDRVDSGARCHFNKDKNLER